VPRDQGGEQQPLDDLRERVLEPGTFLGLVGIAAKIWVRNARSIVYPFLVAGAVIFVATFLAVYWSTELGPRKVLVGASLFLIVGLSFSGSLLSANASVVLSAGLNDSPMKMGQAARSLKPVRSHLLAAAMISGVLALLLLLMFGPLGGISGPHLFLGPPILIHVIALERETFQDAWRRTRSLLSGQTLRTILYLLCLALGLGLMEQIIGALAFTGPATFAFIVFAYAVLGATIGLGLSFMAASTLVSYFGIRSDKEKSFALDDLQRPPEEVA
jgi:hypothetical protein